MLLVNASRIDLFEQLSIVAIVDVNSDKNRTRSIECLFQDRRNLIWRLDHEPLGAERFRVLYRINRTELGTRRASILQNFLLSHHVIGAVDLDQVNRIRLERTAVSSSMAEKRKPPSPDIDRTFSAGRTSVAAIAQGSAIPSVC